MAATKQSASSTAATSMCGKPRITSGLSIAATQSTIWKNPSLNTTPAGVCIQEFASTIHMTETLDAKATLKVANRCIRLLSLPQPKIISPKKPASYMKAVIVS
jgi:hypothetical protein